MRRFHHSRFVPGQLGQFTQGCRFRRGWSRALGHMLLILATVGGTVGSLAAIAVIRPPAAQAYTTRVNLSLNVGPEESYETVANRAALVARTAVQRSFDTDLLVTAVLVTVVAERGTAVAPLMEVEVSRAAWSNRPDVGYWSTYYMTSRSLLGFDDLGGATAGTAPATTPGSAESATEAESTPPNATPGATDASTDSQSEGDDDTPAAAESEVIRDANEQLDRLPGVSVDLPTDPFTPLPSQ